MRKVNAVVDVSRHKTMLKAAGFGLTALMLATSVQALDYEFEEITVTAQKRAESLQDIPFSISAKTGESLTRQGASGYGDYLNSVPGVSFKDLGPGLSQLNIRGASAAPAGRDQTNRKEGVGVYFDESPVSIALFNPDLDVFDVERVEVLRGPQGTLYGAGSLSGTVRVITKKPNPEEFNGAIETGVSSINNGDIGYVTKGVVNIPLSEDTAVRIVAYHNEYGGFIDQVALESPTLGTLSTARDDVNDGSKSGGRIMLLSEGETLTSTFSLVYQKTEANGLPLDDIFNTNISSKTGISGSSLAQTGELEQIRPTDDSNNDEFLMFNATLEYSLDHFDIVSASTFIDRDIQTRRDQTLRSLADYDGAAAAFGNPSYTGFPTQTYVDNNEIQNFTQELRLQSNGDGDLEWMTGVFYQNQVRDYHQIGEALNFESITGVNVVDSYGAITPDSTFDYLNDVTLKQLALFGEATWHMTDQWSATVGLRYFDFKEDFSNNFVGLYAGVGGASFDTSASEDGINPRFILSYAPTGELLFSAQASKGFRLGSANPPIPNTSQCQAAFAEIGHTPDETFDSENLWNYELSAKTSFAENRIVLNAAVFHIDYEDVHLNARVLGCGGGLAFISNAGEATSDGFELDATFRPIQGLDINLGYSYTKAELSNELPGFVTAALGDIGDGDRLPGSPEDTYSVSVNYEFSLVEGYGMYIYGDYQYVGDSITTINDHLNTNLLFDKTDAYALSSVRLGLMSEEGWEVSAYVNNITNELAELSLDREGNGSGRQSFSRNRPRTFGLSLNMTF